MSQSIKDKTVNHFITNEFLIPLLEPTLLNTNVATRRKMGSGYAGKLILKYLHQMMAERPGVTIYAAKIDVSKFFYSIDHEILHGMVRRRIKDPDVLECLKRIMEETNKTYINKMIKIYNNNFGTEIPLYEKGKGLSIGAVTSQFLAVFYLNDLDHKIKDVFCCERVIRYMDDIVIFDWDKDRLRWLIGAIEKELKILKLNMNPKSTIYNCCTDSGVPFLGYRYYVHNDKIYVKCLASTVKRVRKRLKNLKKHDIKKYNHSYEAYRGYFQNAWPEVTNEEILQKL